MKRKISSLTDLWTTQQKNRKSIFKQEQKFSYKWNVPNSKNFKWFGWFDYIIWFKKIVIPPILNEILFNYTFIYD